MDSSIANPIPMTEEQKFFFDLRGWILLPGVLSEEEIGTMKAEAYGVETAQNSQSTNPRLSFQGTLQTLLDHPAIVGVLRKMILEWTPFHGHHPS